MSTVIPNPTTSTTYPPRTFAFESDNKDTTSDNGTSSNIQYWSGLVLSREDVSYQSTRVGESLVRPDQTVEYEAISAMPVYQRSSFEELRLAYYFYDLHEDESDGPTASGTVTTQSKAPKRAWEKLATLSVPTPTPSQSTSSFTAVFPSPRSRPTSILAQTPIISFGEAASYSSPFSSLTSKLGSVSNQLFTNPSTKPADDLPVQAMAALGLGGQPTTPARPASRPLFGPMSLNFHRSPAAERVPAINTAETEWENARRAVAWRKSLLQQAQAEYDNAVSIEREKFKAYSETRNNLDK